MKLLTPAPTEEEQNQQDADASNADAPSPDLQDNSQTLDKSKGTIDPAAEGEEGEEEKEEENPLEKPTVVENDYMDKAGMSPPQDPEGANCLIPDLILTKERLTEILEKALDVTLDWLIQEKQTYHQKCIDEGKALQDQSVEELDENLRKQWPRKGRLEVEIYQERKS